MFSVRKKPDKKLPAMRLVRYAGNEEFIYACKTITFKLEYNDVNKHIRLSYTLDGIDKKTQEEISDAISNPNVLMTTSHDTVNMMSEPKVDYSLIRMKVFNIIRNHYPQYKDYDISINNLGPGPKRLNSNLYIQDDNKIFQGSVDRLMEKGPVNKGFISYRILYLENKGINAWLIASICTLFSLNLVGFPIYQRTYTLGLEVALYDKSGKLVKKYTEEMKKSGFSAMYWGYSMYGAGAGDCFVSTLQRATNAKTFKATLASIIKQIETDIPTLCKQLE